MQPRPFRRQWQRTPQAGVVVLLLLIVGWRWWQGFPQSTAPGANAAGIYQIDHVVDGDTLLLKNRQRVRLIGVDTPESVKPEHPVEPWGREASAFAKEFLASGEARLEFDREPEDQYGRLLAYVYAIDTASKNAVGPPRMLNEALLREGLGRALLKFPYAEEKKRLFRQAEQAAKSAKRGIWSSETGR